MDGDKDEAGFGYNNWFGVIDALTAANAWPVTLKPSGFAGGGQIGYNWQVSPNIVLGVEGDTMGLTGSDSRDITIPLNGGTDTGFITDSAKDRWMATVRARAGWALDRVAVRNSVAFSNWSITHTYADTAGPKPLVADNVKATRTGWTVGGGLEYALTNNWTVRGECLYADFGTETSVLDTAGTNGFPGSSFSVVHKDKLTENIGLFGLNYKF